MGRTGRVERGDGTDSGWSCPGLVDIVRFTINHQPMPPMGHSRPTYTDAFREQILALYRSGRTPRQLADEFQPSEWTIRSWIRKAEKASAPDEISSDREELLRLRKENRRLKLEREILAKSRGSCDAAWFAQETKTLPPSSDL